MDDLLPPPRMVVSSDDESLDDLEDTSRLADIAQSLFDVHGWERSCRAVACGAAQHEIMHSITAQL